MALDIGDTANIADDVVSVWHYDDLPKGEWLPEEPAIWVWWIMDTLPLTEWSPPDYVPT